MLAILTVLHRQRRLKLCRNLNVVVAINAKNVLNHIARTLYIHAVCRHIKLQSLCILVPNLHFKRRNNALNGFGAKLFAYQTVAVFIFKIDVKVG